MKKLFKIKEIECLERRLSGVARGGA